MDKAISLLESAVKQAYPGAQKKLDEALLEKSKGISGTPDKQDGSELERLRKENQELRRLLAAPASGSQAAASPQPATAAPIGSTELRSSPANASNWTLSSTGKRHNNTCRYFGSGKPCGANEGVACKICGG